MKGNMDGKVESDILSTATGYVENTDMKWKDEEKSSVGKDWGKAPSLVEGISEKYSPFPLQRK